MKERERGKERENNHVKG